MSKKRSSLIVTEDLSNIFADDSEDKQAKVITPKDGLSIVTALKTVIRQMEVSERRAFHKKMHQTLEETRGNKEKGALLYLDIDKFLVLLPHVKDEENMKMKMVATRILEVLQEEWEIDGHTFTTTSSIGIAIYPKDGESMEGLLSHAMMLCIKRKRVYEID